MAQTAGEYAGPAKHLAINVGIVSNSAIVTSPGAGIKVRVLAFYHASGAVNVTFETETGNTALTGVLTYAAAEVGLLSYCPVGWFETLAGDDLQVTTDAAMDGVLVYQEVS
jgi:hypothetical protein